MTLFGQAVLWLWIPLMMLLFVWLPPRRAVIAAIVIGFLLMPQGGFALSGLPNFNKVSATGLGLLIGIPLFDSPTLRKFRPSLLDIPVLVWCLVPIPSLMSNGFPLYDGVSIAFSQTLTWGVPYFAGRLYLTDERAFRDLALGLIIGGLVYVPLCLWEIRMSPHLHQYWYGWLRRPFRMLYRAGGFRPIVFMQSPLMVGMYMSAAALACFWMWRSKTVGNIFGIPIAWLVPVLVVTTILCKTTAAITFLMVGMLAYYLAHQFGSKSLIVAIAVLFALYPPTRLGGILERETALSAIGAVYNEERTYSLEVRMVNEDLLGVRALERFWLGWGAYGREAIYDDLNDQKVSISDGLWIIAVGQRGVIGLSALMAMFLLPSFLFLKRIPASYWSRPRYSALSVFGVLVIFYWVDNITNGMINTPLILAIGGLAATVPKLKPVRVRRRRPSRTVAAPAR